jgi:hypothetical protein
MIRAALLVLLGHVEPGWDNCKWIVREWLDGKLNTGGENDAGDLSPEARPAETIESSSDRGTVVTAGRDPQVSLVRAAVLEALDGKPWLFWDEDEDLANAQRVDFADAVVAWMTREAK